MQTSIVLNANKAGMAVGQISDITGLTAEAVSRIIEQNK